MNIPCELTSIVEVALNVNDEVFQSINEGSSSDENNRMDISLQYLATIPLSFLYGFDKKIKFEDLK